MDRAWIDGRPVTLKAATAEAAKLLSASRFPVIAGLGADVGGARAAIALAERLGAAIDHIHSDALLRSLDVMREAGVMITTPSETRARADYLLLVGPEVATTFADLPQLFFGSTGPEAGATSRRVGWICPGRSAVSAIGEGVEPRMIGRNPTELAPLLAAMRARIAGRPISKMATPSKAIDGFVADLAAARFGVAIWSTPALGPLETEMLQGIVADLNTRTRFSSLPIGPADNALGVLQVCGWMTGLPMRTGFGRSSPEHDPWRFDTARMVEAGEVDCAVWISAYGTAAPKWTEAVPVIALTAPDAPMRRTARVMIEVGRPGIDHDAFDYTLAIAALASTAAAKPSDVVSVARVLSEIATTLPTGA
jgi:formylmethanofuran dehydrogenase subunit B